MKIRKRKVNPATTVLLQSALRSCPGTGGLSTCIPDQLRWGFRLISDLHVRASITEIIHLFSHATGCQFLFKEINHSLEIHKLSLCVYRIVKVISNRASALEEVAMSCNRMYGMQRIVAL